MKGKTKRPKTPGFMRQVLAANVRLLMLQRYRDSQNKPKALAKDAGVSLSTVQRILAGANGTNLDNIEVVALALQVSSYQLLIPALHPDNPQVVHGATQDEQRLYKRWQKKELIWETS